MDGTLQKLLPLWNQFLYYQYISEDAKRDFFIKNEGAEGVKLGQSISRPSQILHDEKTPVLLVRQLSMKIWLIERALKTDLENGMVCYVLMDISRVTGSSQFSLNFTGLNGPTAVDWKT